MVVVFVVSFKMTQAEALVTVTAVTVTAVTASGWAVVGWMIAMFTGNNMHLLSLV